MPAIEKVTNVRVYDQQIENVREIDDIIIVTTTNESDDSIINLCKKKIKFLEEVKMMFYKEYMNVIKSLNQM